MCGFTAGRSLNRQRPWTSVAGFERSELPTTPMPTTVPTYAPTHVPSMTQKPTFPIDCSYKLNMADSYGDGWNGAKWGWISVSESADGTNTVQDSGTLSRGSSGQASLCGILYDCYTLTVGTV